MGRVRHVAAGALALMLAGSSLALAASGDLDSTFGTGGKTVVALSTAADAANASLVLPSGKLVVVGQDAGNGGGDIAVMQFTEAGALDPTFGGGDGIVTVDIGGAADTANDVTVDDSNRIVVVGNSGNDLALVRLDSAGVLDPAFDGPGVAGNGAFTLDENGVDAAEGVAMDGTTIVVAGSVQGGTNPGIWQFTGAAGAADMSFGTGGFYDLADDADTAGLRLTNVFLLSNGKLALSGVDTGHLAAAQTSPSHDSLSWYVEAPNASVGSTDSALAATATSGGVVTVAGTTTPLMGDSDILVARFSNSGALDTTFSGDGIATLDTSGASLVDTGNGIDLQPNGKIVMAASINVGGMDVDPAVLRLQGSSPDLAVSAVDTPDPAVTKSPVTVTATVTNNGKLDQTGVSVTAAVSAGATVTAISATGGGACSITPPASCNVGNLAAAATTTITIKVLPTVAGTLTTTVSASGNTVDVDLTNNTAAITTLVKQKMAITLRETTRSGKAKRCGATLRKACKDKFAAATWFKGAVSPGAKARKGQKVLVKVYKKRGKAWKLKKTYTVKLNAKKAYVFKRPAGKLSKGTWRAQSSIVTTTTTSAAASTFRYFTLS